MCPQGMCGLEFQSYCAHETVPALAITADGICACAACTYPHAFTHSTCRTSGSYSSLSFRIFRPLPHLGQVVSGLSNLFTNDIVAPLSSISGMKGRENRSYRALGVPTYTHTPLPLGRGHPSILTQDVSIPQVGQERFSKPSLFPPKLLSLLTWRAAPAPHGTVSVQLDCDQGAWTGLL